MPSARVRRVGTVRAVMRPPFVGASSYLAVGLWQTIYSEFRARRGGAARDWAPRHAGRVGTCRDAIRPEKEVIQWTTYVTVWWRWRPRRDLQRSVVARLGGPIAGKPNATNADTQGSGSIRTGAFLYSAACSQVAQHACQRLVRYWHFLQTGNASSYAASTHRPTRSD